MKTLQLQLTDEQFARLDTLARLTQSTPENLAIASTFAELDSWSTWSEFNEGIEDALCLYTREPRDASSEDEGKRLEDKAPNRIKKLQHLAEASAVLKGQAEDTARVDLCYDEIETICEALNNNLHCDWDENESDDYLEIIALWRKDFENYVEETQALRGKPGALDVTREDSEAFLATQTAFADLLEKLAKQLLAEEVTS